MIGREVSSAVINAGDGCHEHPTQALLDLYTVKEQLGRIEGLKVSIIGDIMHSRVARSNIWGFTRLGAHVTLCGPPTIIPNGMESLGAEVTYEVDRALKGADVVYLLRLQKERQKEMFLSSLKEYSMFYGIDEKRYADIKKRALVMHPGPMNRGVEIKPFVAEKESRLILSQVTNGIAVRMAVLYLTIGSLQ